MSYAVCSCRVLDSMAEINPRCPIHGEPVKTTTTSNDTHASGEREEQWEPMPAGISRNGKVIVYGISPEIRDAILTARAQAGLAQEGVMAAKAMVEWVRNGGVLPDNEHLWDENEWSDWCGRWDVLTAGREAAALTYSDYVAEKVAGELDAAGGNNGE